MWLLLVRMPPVNDRLDFVETVGEITLVGVEFQRLRHHAVRIGQHAVLGHDGVAFDARR
jgi:hypothetical protein